MPIEKVNLGLQVVTTVATIWLGYVGYELAKAQNQIAEVQTYGLPPTVNPREHFIFSFPDDDHMLIEGTLGLQITNNHKYPITVFSLQVDTNVDANLMGCDMLGGIGTPHKAFHLCAVDEVIEAGEVKFLEFPIEAGPYPKEAWLVKAAKTMTAGLLYYDPILDENKITNGPTFYLDLTDEDNLFDVLLKFDDLPDPDPQK